MKDDTLTKEETKIQLLLAEYTAIEQMHAHYDVLNMTMTAAVTAGTLALWGIIVQTSFQSEDAYKSTLYVNNITALAIAMMLVLGVWVRYLTIHRCIVIKKLRRSHKIEKILGMKQNRIFRGNPNKLRNPGKDTKRLDNVRTRPGGHTLELLLYLSLTILGTVIASILQLSVYDQWRLTSILMIGILVIAQISSLFWMARCKLDVVGMIKGKVEMGFPWTVLFDAIAPVNKFLRGIIYGRPKKY